MRGTGYAIAEIIWWMVAAAGIGFLLGWILRRWFADRQSDIEWQERLDEAQGRRSSLERELAERTTTVDRLEETLEAATTRLNGLEGDFTTKVGELNAANARVKELMAGAGAAGAVALGANPSAPPATPDDADTVQ